MTQHLETLRQDAIACFQAGVAAADPYAAVKRQLQFDQHGLQIGERCGDWQRIHLIAFGKAATAMLSAAMDIIPNQYLASTPIAVTNDENFCQLENALVIASGHPLPDQRGLAAAKTIAEQLKHCQSGDLVLCLISGGGSALLPYPVAGISLDDKITTTQLLLSSGANINQINCVRKHCSQLKGGSLARLAAPADLHALILSDVLDDDLSAIASGPCVADPSSFADAIAVLNQYAVWEQTPTSVKQHLQAGASGLQAETPKANDAIFANCSHTLVGSNAISVDATVNAAKQKNYQIHLISQALIGEARLAAETMAKQAKQLLENGLEQATALIAGGETTVSLGKQHGQGGRNQELALAFALSADELGLNGQWCFLSAGTDGRDGPTDTAGGIVDSQTLNRLKLANIDAKHQLNQHNSNPTLQAANDLLVTGATGTNVADLQILLLLPNNQKNHLGEHYV
jgi:hydroxypyruvate reductase